MSAVVPLDGWMSNLNIFRRIKGSKDHSYSIHFKQEIYDKYSWICGREVRNALFCFPSLEAMIRGPGAE
jgi:hypothetical protein